MIEELLHSKKLWALCSHEDPFVRRSVYNLLRSASLKEPDELDWRVISAAVIGKSLLVSQLGSSHSLSEALLQISTPRPQVWTDDYAGKSSSSKRLLQYMQKGSQGGLSSFWSNLGRLLRIIPSRVLARVGQEDAAAEQINLSSASSLVEAFQDGLNSRDEPRYNLAVGWTSYVETGIWLSTLLADEDRAKFIRMRVTPLLEQYVSGASDQRRWTLPTQAAQQICVRCFAALVAHGFESTLRSLWVEVSDRFLETVKLSPPEQSKDFRISQDSICAQARRLFTLESAILDHLQGGNSTGTSVSLIFESTGSNLVLKCVQVLRSRRGKPYGAAAVVQEGVRSLPSGTLRSSHDLSTFLRHDVPELLLSPSGERLVAIALACRKWNGFESSFKDIIERLMRLEPEDSSVPVLRSFLSEVDLREIEDDPALHLLATKALNKAQWPVVITILQNRTLPGRLVNSILTSIVASLSNDETVLNPLHGLSQILSSVPSPVREFQAGPNGPKLAEKLLYLTESSSEEIAGLAETLLKTVKKMSAGDTGAKSGLEILRHNFTQIGDESLS